MTFFRCSLILAIVLVGRSLHADPAPGTTENRLRDALREAKAQASDLQYQLAAVQASKGQADKDNADLKTKVDDLTTQVAALVKQAADDKATSDKTTAELNGQISTQAAQIAQLNQSLAEWKNAYDQATKLATDKEAARAKAVLQSALLQRLVDDRETKNWELYKIGSEILTRYEKFSLGEALEAKEPFAGQSRTKLESLVQDYKDKLLNGTFNSGPSGGPSKPATNPPVRPNIQAARDLPPPAKT